MKTFPETANELEHASLGRRLAAMSYDALLCIALMMVTTGIYMATSNVILGAEAYKALNESGETINDPLLSSILFTTLYFFFGYFWTRNGQTLGMQVWHIRIQTPDNKSISWTQALMRFLMACVSAACLGLGYVWIIFDPQRKSWQCHVSDSEVVRIPKPKKKSKS